jgi:hypothetical protein
MAKEPDMMDKFDFLLGDWDLEYRVPKSSFGEADTGTGEAKMQRTLGGRFVQFDYRATLKRTGTGSARGIFAWDRAAKIYRYWWFEESGNFLAASCDFVADGVLRMNWHDTLLVQTFAKQGPGRVLLRMARPVAGGGHEVIMDVRLTKK